ncbi:hypothetical protein TWF694_008662 [Orbilia ellipsospora]|uniref:Uncharacterized protein n=1 Tax=Orbilia ellipsospora TaxID=2528407 RepID=A0AAV9XI71_9PEZI
MPNCKIKLLTLVPGIEISPSNEVPAETSHLRKRQAFFTEHFGDFDTPSSDVPGQLTGAHGVALSDRELKANQSMTNVRRILEVPAQTPPLRAQSQSSKVLPNSFDDHREPREKPSGIVLQKDYSSLTEPSTSERHSPELPSQDAPLDPLRNSSRFSFEASSAAESIRGEELTLSDSLALKSHHRTSYSEGSDSDIGSFTSDDVHSITSEDLIDEENDGFRSSYPDLSPNIVPPPGFENVSVDTRYNARRLQDLELQEENEKAPHPVALSTGSDKSSEMGTNGSNTEEESGNEFEDNTNCPPFINPPGAGIHGSNTLPWTSKEIELLGDLDRLDSSPVLLFQNIFQTGIQGVNEYDENSISPALGFQAPPCGYSEGTGFIDDEANENDEDDMIAEANRDALASDNDGWYGQEFDFYPTSSTNSTYLAGGFFGIDLPKPGFIRNPSLTPISERSESSLRNSLSIINPISLSSGGISAGPLSAALFTELANNDQITCDDTTLTQLQLLNGTRSHEDSLKHLKHTSTSFSSIPPVPSGQETSSYPSAPNSVVGRPHVSSATPDDPNNYHGGDISTSYIHDVDLGWVMEKRKGGELIQRELVRGAV